MAGKDERRSILLPDRPKIEAMKLFFLRAVFGCRDSGSV